MKHRKHARSFGLRSVEVSAFKRRGVRSSKGSLGKRAASHATDSTEQDYEKAPRKSLAHKTAVRMLLPVKTNHGIIRKTQVLTEQEPLEPLTQLETDENLREKAPKLPLPVQENHTAAQSLSQKYRQLQSVKQRIGALAAGIVEDPQERVAHLKELIALLRSGSPGFVPIVQRLAALTLLEIFRDVVPGYAIAEVAKNPNVRLKKETRALQGFEDALLRHYGQYVALLRKLLARNERKEPRSEIRSTLSAELAHVAARCVCGLLLAHPHFNLHDQLVALVVHCLGSADEELSRTACDTLQQLYRQDRLGEVSLVAVRRTKALLRSRGLKVHPRVLEPFLELRLREKIASQEKPDLKKARERLSKLSRREHKHHKRMQRLDAELREADAQESDVRRDRLQAQILEQLLWTYAHVLKQVPSRPQLKRLLQPVLRGVARFAHLVNLDFLEDLLQALSALLELLDFHEFPLCLQAAFALLSGEGKALNVDPQRFYVGLFQCLLASPVVDVESLLLCWQPMVADRCRSLPGTRLKALVKRLATLCLAHPRSLAPTLALGTLVRSEPRLQVLLDTTDVQGPFRPELPDPDHAGEAPLWELQLLRHHYQPNVAILGGTLASMGRLPPALARLAPLKVARKLEDPLEALPNKAARSRCKKTGVK